MSVSDIKDEPVFDREGMLERLCGDEELLHEVLEVFREECPRMLETARSAARAGDADGVARAAHTLKGALLNISARSAADLAGDLEQMGRSGVLDDCAGLLTRLEAALDRLVLEIGAVGAEAGNPEIPSPAR